MLFGRVWVLRVGLGGGLKVGLGWASGGFRARCGLPQRGLGGGGGGVRVCSGVAFWCV